jgi:N-acetylglucosamine malate deacetylase 1
MIRYQRLLVLAPHTDDAELGCGGTIARLLDEGLDIHVAAFSTAEESLQEGSPPDLLKREFLESTTVLGIEASKRTVYDYPVRRLSYHRQEVLEDLVKLGKEFSPEIVFVPSGSDVHQDHQVLYAEAVRAFRRITLWGYELPWNHISFAAQAFVTLERRHLERKWQALLSYKSQIDMKRNYFTPEFIEGLARVRGAQVGAELAEAFEVVRSRW